MDQTSTKDWRATLEMLNRSLHMGLDKAAAGALRARNLTQLAAMACARSPYHRDRLAPVMGRSGLRLERWEDIPILTKDELRAHRDSILIADPGPESGAVRTGWTAGSEGEPLQYARTALSDYVSSKTTQRFMRWWKMDGNLRLAQIQANRHTANAKPTPAMRRGWMEGHPAGEHHTYPAITDLQGHLGWLQEIRPAYLKGYPEGLGELARLALRQGRVLRFQLLVSGGAVLTEDIRKLCRDAFGCAVADFYGAEEVGSIAAQCPRCGLYHAADENVLLEIVKDNGKPARPGETGRAVVTSLFNHAFPLIRYQIGDYVEAGGSSTCPQPLLTVRQVLGRAKAIFRLTGGRSVWPFIPSSDLGRLPNIKRYQFVQVALERVEFHYVPHDPSQGTDDELLAQLVRVYIDPSLAATSVPVARIERENNLKYMLYRSALGA
jgi:phenylacetate-CoA ligase